MTKKDNGLTRRQLLKIGGVAGGAVALVGGAERALAGPKKTEELPQVPRRILGKTKASVPILLMGGAMKLDQRFDPKLAEALRFGVNYYDMADCYSGGTAETAMGAFHTRAKVRDKVWITTKSDDHEPEPMAKTLQTSLQKMKTKHVEMLYLHALKDEDYLNGAMAKKADELKKAGKIKYFGFSCHHGNVVELLNKAAQLPWIDSVMFRYNFRQYGDKELNKAIDACAKSGVGLIAMKTQGSEASFAKAWKKFEQPGKWNKFQAVLKAVWADERIAAAVSHMDTFEKLKQNIAAAVDKAELSAVDHDAIHRYAALTRGEACDGCDHICGPAVDAPVQIGATMRYLMYHDVYQDTETAQALFRKLPPEAKALSSVDFSGAKQACPHGVDVVGQMRRAAELFEV